MRISECGTGKTGLGIGLGLGIGNARGTCGSEAASASLRRIEPPWLELRMPANEGAAVSEPEPDPDPEPGI